MGKGKKAPPTGPLGLAYVCVRGKCGCGVGLGWVVVVVVVACKKVAMSNLGTAWILLLVLVLLREATA